MDRLLALVLAMFLKNISLTMSQEYTPRPVITFVYGSSEQGDQLNYYYRFGTVPYDAEYFEHVIENKDLQPHLQENFTILIVEYRSKSKVTVGFDPDIKVVHFEVKDPSIDIRYAIAGYSLPKVFFPNVGRC